QRAGPPLLRCFVNGPRPCRCAGRRSAQGGRTRNKTRSVCDCVYRKVARYTVRSPYRTACRPVQAIANRHKKLNWPFRRACVCRLGAVALARSKFLSAYHILGGYQNRRLTCYLTVNILYFFCLKSNTTLEGGDQRRPGHQAEKC